MPKLHRRQI